MPATVLAARQQTNGSGSSANVVSVTVDFGLTFTRSSVSLVLTGLAWVTTTSSITSMLVPPSGVHPDEIFLLDIKVLVSEIVTGVGFTLNAYSPIGARGQYTIRLVGN